MEDILYDKLLATLDSYMKIKGKDQFNMKIKDSLNAEIMRSSVGRYFIIFKGSINGRKKRASAMLFTSIMELVHVEYIGIMVSEHYTIDFDSMKRINKAVSRLGNYNYAQDMLDWIKTIYWKIKDEKE